MAKESVVFISSTVEDLKEFREAARDAALSAGFRPVMQEYFAASGSESLQNCLERVSKCNVLVAIVAHRYGWVPEEAEGDAKSITWLECERAEQDGREVLAFVLDKAANWPAELEEAYRLVEAVKSHTSSAVLLAEVQRNQDRLCDFKRWLDRGRTRTAFNSSADLRAKVIAALNDWRERHPEFGLASIRSPPGPGETDATRYAQALERRHGQLELESLTPSEESDQLAIQLTSVFVEQRVRENPPPLELPKELSEILLRQREIRVEDLGEGVALGNLEEARAVYYENPEVPVIDVLSSQAYQQIVVLGDPGSGKSTLSRYFALALFRPTVDARPTANLPGCIPFLLQLRSYGLAFTANKCKTPLDYLRYLSEIEGWHLSPEAIDRYLERRGGAVVFFDGLDEIFDPEIREQASRQIVDFAADHPNTKTVVTTRIVGYHRRIFASAGFHHFTLQDLDEAQILQFLRRWYTTVYPSRPEHGQARFDRITDAMHQSASLRQLAGNPMLLTIMAILGRRRELPQEKHKLYQHAAAILIQHWDINRYLRQQEIPAYVGEEQKTELLQHIADAMQRGRGGIAGNYIHQDQLAKEIVEYLQNNLAESDRGAKAIAHSIIEQLRRRNFILSKYGGSVYGFVHRGFLEYFCALYFKEQFERKQELLIDDLKLKLYGRHWLDRSWHEVLRLFCAMVHERFAGEIIDYLLLSVYLKDSPASDRHYLWNRHSNETRREEFSDDDDNEDDPRVLSERVLSADFYRPYPWNVALAVQCLAEVINPTRLADTVRRVLRTACALFDYCMIARPELKEFMIEHIVPHLEQFGKRCDVLDGGDRFSFGDEIADWLASRQRARFDWAWLYSELFGRFVGAVGAGSSRVLAGLHQYVEHEDKDRRVLAVFALANGWSESDATVETLHKHAARENEPEADVRWASISALAHYRRDEFRTFTEIEKATLDISPGVRAVACRLLGVHFRDNKNTRSILAYKATSDVSMHVRVRALEALIEGFPTDAATAVVVADRAKNDDDWRIRELAQRSLDALRTLNF